MLRKSKAILILVAVLPACEFAAHGGFVRTWGGTGSTSPGAVALDGSSNAYVVGGFSGTVDFDPGPATSNRTSKGLRDAFLSKFASDGTWLWTRTWGSTNDDRANSVVVYGSNVYVSGAFQDTVDFNPSGGDPYTALRNTNNLPDNDAYLCKYDPNGNYKWTRTWGGNGGDEAYEDAVDGAGNVYVCGDFGSTNIDLALVGATGSFTNHGRWDAFLFKFDANGSNLWARSWGGIYYDDCTCVAADGAGNVYGGGMFASPVADFDPGPGTNDLYANNPGADWGLVDVFLTKFDSNGNFQWARSWGESNDWDAAQGVAVDGATDVYVSGYFAFTVNFNPPGLATNIASHGAADAFLCKYGSTGDFKWVRTWGGTNNDYARGNAVDDSGYVFVSGDFSSTNIDFDPGSGVDMHSSHGGKDISLSKFDPDGNFILARTCGGSGDDAGYGGVVVDGSGNAFEAGQFVGPVDFGPLIGGTTSPAFYGSSDAFLAEIPSAWKLTVVRSGNGWSSLGAASPATRFISLGVTTQIVFTAADWYRILAFASNSTTIGAAAGTRAYTQTLVNVALDLSNDVVFALANTNQTGYPSVPTVWLTNWAESAVISDSTFDVHAKYVIGLDPTTSNTFDLSVESIGVSNGSAVIVLKRAYTGGLSPDGMHGQLALQATASPVSAFTNIAGTAVTGAGVFDGTNRRTYTNAVDITDRFIRGVIQ